MHLILFGVVGFDGFGLDDNCCITFGHGSAFSGNGTGHITRGESKSHRNGCGDRHCQVLDCLNEALFLSVS